MLGVKIYKNCDSSLVAHLILHLFILIIFSIFKTVGMRALPAKPFLASKMAEHDVTLTSIVANLS